jgi:glycosyltransferase involved in cell wall biosynthesis
MGNLEIEDHSVKGQSLSRMALGLRVVALRLREKLEFDSHIFRLLFGVFGIFLAWVLNRLGRVRDAVQVVSKIHSSGCSDWSARIVEQKISETLHGTKTWNGFHAVLREHVEQIQPNGNHKRWFDNPRPALDSMAIVLKSARDHEKGVISILYSYALPLFARLFDINRVVEKYHVVLEPSWSGYCNLDVLCYARLEVPVFVQAYEPRDEAFIRALNANLVPVPVSNNWWVDHRRFRPLAEVPKDVDVIMIAGWVSFKRHHEFFHGLMKLRKKGIALKTVLVGYPNGYTRSDIVAIAAYYGVVDQLEIFEWISPEEVNYQLNRSKVNIIWSRREGVNRAVIEGLFAGVPCILREGFNYGFRYPYINAATGVYCSETELPGALVRMIQNYQRYAPRGWVKEHMSCQRATAILSNAIKLVAVGQGEKWSEDLAVKVNGLYGQEYWNAEDGQRFENDYNFLMSCIRQ